MKAVKFALVCVGLICFLFLLAGTALARTHFHISFGTGFVHDCYYGGYNL